MRVDFVITELFVGGAERCLTELAIGLAENGDDVRVFSIGSLPTGSQRLLVDRLAGAKIEVESGHADQPSQFLGAKKQLQAWLTAAPPDVCQTFLFHANVLGTWAAKSAGIATRLGGLRVAESKAFRCFVERQAVKRMTSLICVSQAVRQFATNKLGCDRAKSIVIPNSVNVTRFATARPLRWSEIGWPDDSLVSLFVGRFHPQKNLELLQSQIDRLAPAGSNRRLLLVGDGPLRDDLADWAAKVGHDRVQVLPWRSDIERLMQAARLLLLPSRYEGMPNVVLEAMACAKPVVCSLVEGSAEVLAHDRQRQGFSPGDADAMCRLADAFAQDESLCEEVGANNQARVRADFSIPAMIDAYRGHYRTLLAATT